MSRTFGSAESTTTYRSTPSDKPYAGIASSGVRPVTPSRSRVPPPLWRLLGERDDSLELGPRETTRRPRRTRRPPSSRGYGRGARTPHACRGVDVPPQTVFEIRLLVVGEHHQCRPTVRCDRRERGTRRVSCRCGGQLVRVLCIPPQLNVFVNDEFWFSIEKEIFLVAFELRARVAGIGLPLVRIGTEESAAGIRSRRPGFDDGGEFTASSARRAGRSPDPPWKRSEEHSFAPERVAAAHGLQVGTPTTCLRGASHRASLTHGRSISFLRSSSTSTTALCTK